MNEVVREFLLETNENLAQLDLDLVTLEKDPGERETLSRVFRTVHTVKGTAGFLGLLKLQSVAHAAENLLSQLREGNLTFNPAIANTLLGVVDAVRRMLEAVEKSETEGDDDYAALIGALERLLAAPQIPAAVAPASDVGTHVDHQTQKHGKDGQAAVSISHSTTLPKVAKPGMQPEEARDQALPPPSVTLASTTVAEPAVLEATEQRSSLVSDSSIRVDVGLLDKLMTLVGELVLARNQIMQFSMTQENAPFLGTVQRLNLLTSELQTGVMKMRMQPIGNIWSKFPRLVRDLAVACGKQVRIEMEGRETELDKTIVEAIRDPLTHLVRNGIDHGIEPPAQRVARDKPAQGRLALHAFHEGGKVIIEITDDGGGIDPQRIRDKAIQNKLVTAEQAARMNDRELLNLIFLPGFSTAEKVTHFSGRGVGMDVVQTNIAKIGGSVEIASQIGRGTTVKMKIPLTLAIIPALTITSGGDRYAIPQVSLLELVRLEGEQSQRGIEQIHGAPVYRLRGNLLPLVYLNSQLQVEAPRNGPVNGGEINIVVLQADERQFGLVVDAIHDTEEIVVKPLQKQLKGINVYAGATIMGDGTVALILDVLGLAQHANIISDVRERALTEKPPSSVVQTGDRQTVILFATPEGGRMAIPLSLVSRLEEFPRSALEKVGAQDVVQYRDEILPLIHVARALRRQNRREQQHRTRVRRKAKNTMAFHGDDTVQAVVCAGDGRRVGLVIGQILDIVEETLVSRSCANRPCVLFTAVIQGRVTEFLDVEAIIRSADPDLLALETVSQAATVAR